MNNQRRTARLEPSIKALRVLPRGHAGGYVVHDRSTFIRTQFQKTHHKALSLRPAASRKAIREQNSSTASNPTASVAALKRLTQEQASWLIGKPTSWTRDHSHLFLRDESGRYDARDVVRAIASVRAGPVELSDEHLEPMQQWLYDVTESEGRLTGCLRVLNEIEQAHGVAGLAAIGALVKEIAKEHLRRFPQHETTGELNDMRGLYACEGCGKYRMGRKWLKPPLPAGYVKDSVLLCPKCE